ncbi:hypothetical protein [Brachybacterium hainanense]|uniref:Uncharacterized protein n=1 Tax=Brachybacterium hainanense TaxID=1541174 RepID=A0ABV6RH07_9MICO
MDLAFEYANHVAPMAMLPSMRQGISDLSTRVLDSHILMPFFQRQELSFSAPGSE